MPKPKRIYSPAYRKRIAYTTAFSVAWSYYWLHLKAKIGGKAYYERKIQILHQHNATKIKERIIHLQGLFVKFGQLISILSNILPEAFREPLASLQDKNTPRPLSEVEAVIQEQLGASPQDLFDTFDENPIASASIGQVHRATFQGQDVVVKVQHLNIDTVAKADLEILKRLVAISSWIWEIKGNEHSYTQVKLMIEEELDYKLEAQSMQRIGASLRQNKKLNIDVPLVFLERCASKVLTSSYCSGTNIGNLEQLNAWGINKNALAERLTQAYCSMVLADGFYHADPHPGNILVQPSGKMILLDFGAVARLNGDMRAGIPLLIESVVKDDSEGTVSALKKMGFIGSGREAERIAEKLTVTFREFVQEELKIDSLNFKDIELDTGLESMAGLLKRINLTEVFKTIQVPKDWVLLNRTVVLVIGTTFNLDEQFDIFGVIRPYLQKNIVEGEQGFRQMITNAVRTQFATAIALPNELQRFLQQANKGELEFQIRDRSKDNNRSYQLGQQLIFALIAIALLFFKFSFDTQLSPNTKIVLNIGMSISLFLFLRAWWRGGRKT